MPAERQGGPEVLAVTAIALAVCCGLPILLSLGAAVTIAGIGLRSWVVAVAGAVIALAGAWVVNARRRAAPEATDGRGPVPD